MAGLLASTLAAADAGTVIESVRVITTEPACFEYVFTGVMHSADGESLLAFNHRNGRSSFVRPGDALGQFRVIGYVAKTNQVYYPSLNASLDEPAGQVTLAGPGRATIVLEQDQRLPRPGRVAWLVRLDNGLWWNIQEQDVFSMDGQPVFVEEVDEDGATVTAGGDLVFIRRMSPGDQDALNRLWADRKRQEQQALELALQRQREEAARAATAAAEIDAAPVRYEQGTHVEIRGPARFFYGCEYRFPVAFGAYTYSQNINGRLVPSSVVLPTRFETRYSGISLTGP